MTVVFTWKTFLKVVFVYLVLYVGWYVKLIAVFIKHGLIRLGLSLMSKPEIEAVGGGAHPLANGFCAPGTQKMKGKTAGSQVKRKLSSQNSSHTVLT